MALRGGRRRWSCRPAVEQHAALVRCAHRRAGSRRSRLLRAEANRTNPALAIAAAAHRMNGNEHVRQQRTDAKPRRRCSGSTASPSIFFQEHDEHQRSLVPFARAFTRARSAAWTPPALMFGQEPIQALATPKSRALHCSIAFSRLRLMRIAPTCHRSLGAGRSRARGRSAYASCALSAEGGDSPRQTRTRRHVSQSAIVGTISQSRSIQRTDRSANANRLASLHFARGAARERLGRWPEAEADFRRALELSPGSARRDELSGLHVDRPRRAPARRSRHDPARRRVCGRCQAQIIDSLGWAYYQASATTPRRSIIWKRAIQNLSLPIPTLNDHLGDIYWRLGRRIEARFQWQRALTFEPDRR